MAQWQRIHLPMQEMWVQSLGQEDPLEKETATHSSILAWENPWTEEGLMGQSPWGHKRVKYNSATEQQQKCITFKSDSLLSNKILEQYRLLGYAITFSFKSRRRVLKINIKIASRTTELIISLIS